MRVLQARSLAVTLAAAVSISACDAGDGPLTPRTEIRPHPVTRSLECTTSSCTRPLSGSEWSSVSGQLDWAYYIANMTGDMACANYIVATQEYLSESVVVETYPTDASGNPYYSATTPYTGSTSIIQPQSDNAGVHLHETIHRFQRTYETEAVYNAIGSPQYVADEADADNWRYRCIGY